MSDWVWPATTVFATLMGPILAVQAQKWIERRRERNNRKSVVFHQLMATRANRLSQEHVQALNMIDLAFYGRRVVGVHRPTKSEIAVTDAWHEYLDHLHPGTADEAWGVRGDELFTNLLNAMAEDVGYSFDRVQLRKGAYSPNAHGQQEAQLQALRRLICEVLAGDRAIKMDVTSFPFSPEALDAQAKLQSKLTDALDVIGALRITIVDGSSQQGSAPPV